MIIEAKIDERNIISASRPDSAPSLADDSRRHRPDREQSSRRAKFVSLLESAGWARPSTLRADATVRLARDDDDPDVAYLI